MGEMEATGQNTQFDLGHWFLRLIALIIDAIILGIIAAILFFLLFIPFLFVGSFAGFFAAWGWALGFPLVVGVLMVLYFLYADVNWGGTFGKRIVGLRVQSVKGGKINYNQAFIRNISKIYWIFMFLDWIIGIATPGDKRQKYTDRIAGTIVVQTSQVIPIPTQAPSQ
jgi:uncharacterized RDD family membrane protein YckC